MALHIDRCQEANSTCGCVEWVKAIWLTKNLTVIPYCLPDQTQSLCFSLNYSWPLNYVGLNCEGQLKNPCISRPALFKPTLFKGQLYSDFSCIQAFRSLFGSLLILASSFCELFPLPTCGSLSPKIAAISFFFSVYTCCSPLRGGVCSSVSLNLAGLSLIPPIEYDGSDTVPILGLFFKRTGIFHFLSLKDLNFR